MHPRRGEAGAGDGSSPMKPTENRILNEKFFVAFFMIMLGSPSTSMQAYNSVSGPYWLPAEFAFKLLSIASFNSPLN